MKIIEKEIKIPWSNQTGQWLSYFQEKVSEQTGGDEIPIRFVITEATKKNGFKCEIGTLVREKDTSWTQTGSIFDFTKRSFDNTKDFNVVLLVPTGIGAEIGGHAGDAGPVARLLAAGCDNLITHPNVVNASDINELPDNCLYVEGSVIARLLMGEVALKKVKNNRVMMIMDSHPQGPFFEDKTINSFNAARATLGMNGVKIIRMEKSIEMTALWSESGRAVGQINHFERLAEVIDEELSQFDALALCSVIKVPKNFHTDYYDDELGMVNPWGGVEAMLTHTVSSLYNIPSAHSPMMSEIKTMNLDLGVVDPRKSAEIVSMAFLHCIFKGLHRSPQIITDPLLINHPDMIGASNISALVIPEGCLGLPTMAAVQQDIPIVVVKGNKNQMKVKLEQCFSKADNLYVVDNYLEAVGLLQSLKSGIAVDTVTRPLKRVETIIRKAEDSVYSKR